MKTFLQTFGAILITLGLMVIAGAAGDCDGHCGAGNTLPVMLMLMGLGSSGIVLGWIMFWQSGQIN